MDHDDISTGGADMTIHRALAFSILMAAIAAGCRAGDWRRLARAQGDAVTLR